MQLQFSFFFNFFSVMQLQFQIFELLIYAATVFLPELILQKYSVWKGALFDVCFSRLWRVVEWMMEEDVMVRGKLRDKGE